MIKKLVLASHNPKKLVELNRIIGAQLTDAGIELLGYDGPEPRETGTSFEANALLKARAAAEHTGLPAVADDSGIAVDILGGSPGIFSARWAGSHGTGNSRDEANLNLLLEQLADIAQEHRAASFVCAAALVVPGEIASEHVELGVWPGEVLTEARGLGGFGYDPLFKPQGFEVSAAELTPAQKDEHSHRTRAFKSLAKIIIKTLS